MTDDQKRIINGVPGKWLNYEGMKALYPTTQWRTSGYFLIIRKERRQDIEIPTSYVYLNEYGNCEGSVEHQGVVWLYEPDQVLNYIKINGKLAAFK